MKVSYTFLTYYVTCCVTHGTSNSDRNDTEAPGFYYLHGYKNKYILYMYKAIWNYPCPMNNKLLGKSSFIIIIIIELK